MPHQVMPPRGRWISMAAVIASYLVAGCGSTPERSQTSAAEAVADPPAEIVAHVPVDSASPPARAGASTPEAREETPGDWQGVQRESMMELKSRAFDAGEPIPVLHTCDGKDLSLPLSWSDPPKETASFSLIVDDPDAPAGTWVHWVVYGIPAESRDLPEGLPPDPELPDGTRQGRNDFRRLGYGGPCPPRGHPHRYVFKLYALDKLLDLAPGATKGDLLEAMEGHVLGRAELTGTYKRNR